MTERHPPESIIDGLLTKADKIRALARAGFSISESAQFLGIKYQHVRHVLVRSGFPVGRRSATAAIEPISSNEGTGEAAAVTEPPKTNTVEVSVISPGTRSWEILLRAGFRFLGEWKIDESEELILDTKVPSAPGVYAFILEDQIVYVGITQMGFSRRMYSYRRGYARHKTSSRVKELILTSLKSGQRVKVLIAQPDATSWSGLPVDTSAGLESGLIRHLKPAWNVLGVVREVPNREPDLP